MSDRTKYRLSAILQADSNGQAAAVLAPPPAAWVSTVQPLLWPVDGKG